MRSGPNNRRSRGRGNGGRRGGQPRSNFESNGPDVRVRGSVQQVVDKYQALAREASTAGDPIKAEGFYQHAEHYLRVLTAQASAPGNNSGEQQAKVNENNTESKKQNADTDSISSSDTPALDGNEVHASATEMPAETSSDSTVEEVPVVSKNNKRTQRHRRPKKELKTQQEELSNNNPDTDNAVAQDSSTEQQGIA